jgi:type II restriction enzyme
VAPPTHPDNRHVPDKIRQQLQVLRDLGFVEFLGGGRYRCV